MLEHRSSLSVKRMSTLFCVSRSGFYGWLKNRDKHSARATQQKKLDESVRQAFIKGKQREGARRLQKALAEEGHHHDIKTIRSSMKRQHLEAKAAKKFKVTTNSKHNLPIAPNLLEQDFSATQINQKWAGDITYLLTSEGWLYLAVIIDLYSRNVIGWSMNTRMTSDLVCDALKSALFRRGMPKNVIVHSDRGSQYCSNDYRALMSQHQLQQSMSRKGNCWDNACVESFFHTLKIEALDNDEVLTREQMRQTVFEYIEVDYNRTRRHSSLGYLSPEIFEQQNIA